jgi:hypothetical protein
LHSFGGERDCTKYQIYFASPPSCEEGLFLTCYHCNEPIVMELDKRYVIVAAAFQRPLYFHDNSCYEEFLHGMVLFYKEILCPMIVMDEAAV